MFCLQFNCGQTTLIYLFDLPIQARADGSLAEVAGSPESGMYAQILNQAFVGDIANQFTASLRHETCNRVTIWENIFGGHLPDCVNEEQFKRARSGEQ